MPRRTRVFFFGILMQNTLILGIGNSLLGDEGAGPLVIQYLQQHFAEEANVEYLDGGTLSFTLAGTLASHGHLILVDATNLKAAPGSIQVFEGAAMDAWLSGSRTSVHEVSLGDLLDITRLTGDMPQRRALIGIQPGRIDWSETPSPAVAAAIEPAALTAIQLHRQWQQSTAQMTEYLFIQG